jgi:hypothetical protein
MATNPQAEGQTRINFQISEVDRDTLIRLAEASGMKLSAYIRLVLEEAVAEELIFKRTHSKKSTPTVVGLDCDDPTSQLERVAPDAREGKPSAGLAPSAREPKPRKA